MAYKRAEIVGAGLPFKFVTEDIAVPPPGLVRVKVAFAGVCHSDVHQSHDGLGITPLFGEDKFIGMVLGHEISGHIDEAGKGVDLSALGLKLGDPVMVYPWVGCENCDACQLRHSNLCSDPKGHGNNVGCGPYAKGGYQTHMVIKPQHLVKVPDTISMDVACMLPCSAGTSYAALLKLTEAIQLQQNQGKKARLLLIGVGGLGLWAIQLAKVMFGADKIHIVAADVDEAKLDTATKYGADETVFWDTSAEQETTVQNTIKNGKMDAAVDYVSVESTSRIAVQCMAQNGTLVFVGLKGGNFQAHFFELIFNQLTVRGSKVFNFGELKNVVALVDKHKLSFPALEYYSLEQVYDVILKLAEGKINGRALIKY